jgi:mevalonate kinase
MATAIASSPGKIILFGEHGVNRQQPALSTAVNIRLYCRVNTRMDETYSFRSGEYQETGSRDELVDFKRMIDALRASQALNEIRETARDFFAPPRYVLAHVFEHLDGPGFNVEWRSPLPVGAGMGSGAAAYTAMIMAATSAAGKEIDKIKLVDISWQGDIIAHGGIASSLDSSTCVFGGLIRYTVDGGVQPISLSTALPLVIGDTLVNTTTAELNTRVRKWLSGHPARMHIFRDMGYTVDLAARALEDGDLQTLGPLMNLHQLIQEKIGTSCPEAEQLIDTAIGAGAFGAKISGAGGGGVIIALVNHEEQEIVAQAIAEAGGRSYITTAGAGGTRIESEDAWVQASYE